LEIIPFLFNDINNIRTLKDEHGNIWFVAKDIADVLEYSQTQAMLKRIDDEDILKLASSKIDDSNSKAREFAIINESGLYSAILGSKKPEAKQFKRWITNEVLPSIRKTGNYSISKTQTSQNLQLPEIGNLTQKIIELDQYFVATINLLKNLREQNPIDLYHFDKYILENKNFSPLQTFKINLENQFFLPTELGKMINKSPVEINLILEYKGFQVRENGIWKMTESDRDFGIEINGQFSQIKWKIKTIV